MAVVLPRLVTFRGNNERLLRRWYNQDSWGQLYFEAADDFIGLDIMHEVIQDGTTVTFVSRGNGQPWRVFSNIRTNPVAAVDPRDAGQIPTARFTITHLGSNAVALRAVDNNLFCSRVTNFRVNEFRAVDANVTESSRLIVGEPVAERELENIRYNLDEARIYDNKLVVLGTNRTTNNSSFLADVELGVSYQLDTLTNWTNSITVGASLTMRFFAGAPNMTDGRLQVTLSSSYTREWGQSVTQSRTVNTRFVVKDVAPGSAVTLTVTGSEAKYDVPFSYTQNDLLINGDRSSEDRTDGIFRGVNAFNVQYEAIDQFGHTFSVQIR